MPKISGLGLGEIKKISGLGLGNIKKVSGLGLGVIWQSLVASGMVHSGSAFTVTTTIQESAGWAAASGSTMSGNALVANGGGSATIATSVEYRNTVFGTKTVEIEIRVNGTSVGGTTFSLSANSTSTQSYTTGTVDLPTGALVTYWVSVTTASGVTLTSNAASYVQIVPAP